MNKRISFYTNTCIKVFAILLLNGFSILTYGSADRIHELFSENCTVNSQVDSFILGPIDLGGLPNFLFFFNDGSGDANWQSASKGYVGDAAINGLVANERSSGTFAYAGTIYTNDNVLNKWQDIIDNNIPPEVATAQAFGQYNQVDLLAQLENDLTSAMLYINSLSASSGYEGIDVTSLNGLNLANGTQDILVVNVTNGLSVSSQINITGDNNDLFILRWDDDANFSNGYNGQVKFQSGGAIIPLGGLTPGNFIHVAGDLNASGGGSNPPAPYPQGPRLNNGTGSLIQGGEDFNGGGFFTGYWLTTGKPSNLQPSGLYTGDNSSLSNAIFVGGWYSLCRKFSMTSGTSGSHYLPANFGVECNLATTSFRTLDCSNNTVDLEITFTFQNLFNPVTVNLNGTNYTFNSTINSGTERFIIADLPCQTTNLLNVKVVNENQGNCSNVTLNAQPVPVRPGADCQ